MNEREARAATLLQAFESADPASPSWSAEDRRWVDRVALEAVGSAAPADAFIAERAQHAMRRLLPRERAAQRWLARPARWGSWLGLVVVLAAVSGVVLGPGLGTQRINLVVPPFWGVVLWNLGVYAALLIVPLVAASRRRPSTSGPLRRGVEWLLRSRLRTPAAAPRLIRFVKTVRGLDRAPTGPALQAARAAPLARFAALWSTRSARLLSLRAQTVLHAGAAALGLGLIAGLYLRGLVFDYRVGWESTFLSPNVVQAFLAAALAPASALSGIGLPDAAGFAALQTQPGAASAGAPAAMWIHLLALTLTLFVVVPRFLLAAGCAAWLRRSGRRFALPLDEPYFQRLTRLQRGAAAEVVVVPYAHTPTPQAALGLHALIAEAFGPKAVVRIAPTTAFGAEDSTGQVAPATRAASHVLLLFDLAATPEVETYGRFAGQLIEGLPAGAMFAWVVDEAAFRRRFAGLSERLQQRRTAWTELGARLGCAPVFADLEAAPDAAAALLTAFAAAPHTPIDAAPVRKA